MDKIKAALFIILLLAPAIISYEVRHTAASLPITDDWASSAVYSYYSNQIGTQINSQYPNLPPAQLQAEINKQMNSQVVNNPQVQAQIAQVSLQFKDAYRYDNNQYVYMPNIDPYEYLRRAQEFIDNGHIGDLKKSDGTWWDMHTLAPVGSQIFTQDLHPMMLAFFYKIGSFFNNGTTLMQTSGYLPAIFVSIGTIFLFLLLRRYTGDFGASLGALLYGVHPLVLSRTLWANTTTESYGVMLIPMAFYFASEMLARDGKIRYLSATLSGLAFGIFSFSWNQWYYAFDILLGVIGICAFIQVLKLKKEMKETPEAGYESAKPKMFSRFSFFASIIVFLLSACIFVSIFGLGGFRGFIDAPFVAMTNFQIKAASYGNLWPNVYTTVAELSPINLPGIISLIGNIWVIIAIIGFIGALWNKEWFIASSFVLLTLGGITASLVAGVRFTLFLGLPVAIGAGLAFGYVFKYVPILIGDML